MKKKINCLNSLVVGCFGLASISTMVCTNAFAEIVDNSNCFTPYVGVSAQREHLRFDRRFGGPLYNRSIASGSILAGLKFNDYFGIEFDYALSQRKNKVRTLREGDLPPDTSIALTPGQFEIYKTRLALDTISLSLTGLIPLDSINICDTALFGSFGGSLLKLKANHRLLAYDGGEATPFAISRTSYGFKNSYRKLVPLVKLGLERQITNKISLRAFCSWKKVASFNTESTGLLIAKGHLRFRSALGYGISLLYYF